MPLIVDNTAAPIICRPLEHGAAVVMYSTTKYIGGHGTSIGGLVIDGGNFDWQAHAERFPTLNEPDPSYHGAVWVEAAKPLGPIAYILRMRVVAAARPRRGDEPVQRLPVPAGSGNAAAAHARALRERRRRSRPSSPAIRKVAKVIFPGLQSGEMRRRADAYLAGGYGALLGFELKDGREAGRRFIDALQAGLPRRQHRRRADAGDPSGDDHALAAFRRGPARDRRLRGLRAAVDRHRAHRRHPRRPLAGAGGRVDEHWPGRRSAPHPLASLAPSPGV